MLIKWLGGGLLLMLTIGYSVGSVRRWLAVERLLDAWTVLLTYARGQISCFGMPLSVIMQRAPHKVREVLGAYAADGREDFVSLCRITADVLPDASAGLLRALADEVGTIWRQEQLERLSYYITALEQERTALATALPGRMKLQSTLSLCGVLALILLLW